MDQAEQPTRGACLVPRWDRRGVVLLAAVLVSACAYHRQPYLMYEGRVPLGETSVFSSVDEKALVEARIEEADGRRPSCAQAGCPYWVRVLPGTHSFKVKLSYQGAVFEISVADMKARHVYAVHYYASDKKQQCYVEDLGENPNFGITLGLSGVNRTFYPVSFEDPKK